MICVFDVVIQVSALRCSAGVENLVLLDRERLKPMTHGVAAAGVTVDSEVKWKVGEAEFESLMRMLDNLVSDLTIISDLSHNALRFLSHAHPEDVWEYTDIIIPTRSPMNQTWEVMNASCSSLN